MHTHYMDVKVSSAKCTKILYRKKIKQHKKEMKKKFCMTTTCAYMHIATAVVERMSASISCRMMKRCNGKKIRVKAGKMKNCDAF